MTVSHNEPSGVAEPESSKSLSPKPLSLKISYASYIFHPHNQFIVFF
jgi:hypothetical protein